MPQNLKTIPKNKMNIQTNLKKPSYLILNLVFLPEKKYSFYLLRLLRLLIVGKKSKELLVNCILSVDL